MKRIITLLAICAIALCVTSCFKQTPALTITPASVTIKVGESVQLHPGMEGEAPDLKFSDLIIINSEDGIAFLDSYYKVTGYKAGTTRVGVGIPNDKNDISKGLKYSAFTTVKVVE